MKQPLVILNQLFELEQKLKLEQLEEKVARNLQRIWNAWEEEGYLCKNPIHENYSDTRTDVEATIIGQEAKHMVITQVIKPIIFKKEQQELTLLQKGVVMVERK